MVEPTVYLFRVKGTHYELYLGEYSTVQGLLLFDNNEQIAVRSASGSDSTNNDWITEKNFKTLNNTYELIQFLNDNPTINLIDIEIDIEGFGSLSTHDDGECHFQSSNKNKIIALVEKTITKRDFLPLQISLLEHPNKYVVYNTSGNTLLYSTFDDYLGSTE